LSRIHPFRVPAFALLILTLASTPLRAQGGPPLITDDPDTPGPRHWEINVSFFRQHTPGARLSERPGSELRQCTARASGER
jgi:hypothetical protein